MNAFHFLQHQPPAVRKIACLVGAFLGTGVIAAVWYSTLSAQRGEVSTKEETAPSVFDPLTTVVDSTRGQTDDFKETFGGEGGGGAMVGEAVPSLYEGGALDTLSATRTEQVPLKEERPPVPSVELSKEPAVVLIATSSTP